MVTNVLWFVRSMCFWELYSQHTSVCRAAFATCWHFFPSACRFVIFFGFVSLYGLYLGCDTRAMARVIPVSGPLCSLCFYDFPFICHLAPHFLCPEVSQTTSVWYGLIRVERGGPPWEEQEEKRKIPWRRFCGASIQSIGNLKAA